MPTDTELYSQQVPALLSCISSGCVVLTYFTFSDLRQLRYVELVYYVSLNDFIASFGLALGATRDGSAKCWIQAITTNFNFLSSILWTAIITYQVWRIVHEGEVIKDLSAYHCLCWCLPLLVTFLPLSTNSFGNNDDSPSWCYIENSNNWTDLFWHVVSFYGWVWLTFFYNIVRISSIIIKLRKLDIMPEKIRGTLRKLILYPLITSTCWIINTITDFDWQLASNRDLNTSGVCLSALQGFFYSAVFFSVNPIVQYRWKKLFKNYYHYLFSPMASKEEDIIRKTESSTSYSSGNSRIIVSENGRIPPLSENARLSEAFQVEKEPDFIPFSTSLSFGFGLTDRQSSDSSLNNSSKSSNRSKKMSLISARESELSILSSVTENPILKKDEKGIIEV